MKDMIEIYGMHWFWLGLFVIICFTAGFIIFPAWVVQHTWNFFAAFINRAYNISLFAATLLWLIISISTYIKTKEKFKISIENGNASIKDNIRQVIREARRNGVPLKFLQEQAKRKTFKKD